jgi:replicative DNA helicase
MRLITFLERELGYDLPDTGGPRSDDGEWVIEADDIRLIRRQLLIHAWDNDRRVVTGFENLIRHGMIARPKDSSDDEQVYAPRTVAELATAFTEVEISERVDIEKTKIRVRRRAQREVEEEEWRQLGHAESSSRALSGGSVLDEPEQVPAVWGLGDEVLWAEGEGCMIAAHQGCGKTTIAQQVVLHAIGVRRGPLLGYPVRDDGGVVLYLALDRPRQAMRSFRRMVTDDAREIMDRRLVIWQGPLPVNPVASRTALADFIASLLPAESGVDAFSFVIVDSVKDLAPGVSKDEVGAALNLAWQEVISRGTDLMLLHHGRKAGEGTRRTPELDSIYGSTWLTSGLGSVIILDGEPGAAAQRVVHPKRPAELVEFTLKHDHTRGVSVRSDQSGATVEDILRDADEELTLGAIAVMLYGSDESKFTTRVRRDIDKLNKPERMPVVVKTKGIVTSEGRQPDTYRWQENAGRAAFAARAQASRL